MIGLFRFDVSVFASFCYQFFHVCPSGYAISSP